MQLYHTKLALDLLVMQILYWLPGKQNHMKPYTVPSIRNVNKSHTFRSITCNFNQHVLRPLCALHANGTSSRRGKRKFVVTYNAMWSTITRNHAAESFLTHQTVAYIKDTSKYRSNKTLVH